MILGFVGLGCVAIFFFSNAIAGIGNTPGSQVGSNQATEPQAKTAVSNRLAVVTCITCHGSQMDEANEPDELWKSAFQIWSSLDPHSNAYTTLSSRQSKKIVKALAGSSLSRVEVSQLKFGDAAFQNILNQRCVSCHSSFPPDLAKETSAQRDESPAHNSLYLADGVNCHSCHSTHDLHDPNGNAWIEQHYKQAWDTGEYDQSKSGLADLSDLKVRAETCVKCHVGSPGRDVNHDLIAAGHPRMVFEYSSYLARLPKHWTEQESEDFHVQCWSIGNSVTLDAALRLLEMRAQLASHANGPWPEFTEYNCHNCHHQLTASWYQAFQNEHPGKPMWGTWAFPKSIQSASVEPSDTLNNIRVEMEKSFPSAELVQSLLQDSTHQEPGSRFDHLYSYLQQTPQLNSDEIYHWYSAVSACLNDLPADDPEKKSIRPMIQELEKILFAPFPNQSQTESAAEYTSEQVANVIEQVRQAILPILQKRQ